jgi:hypothetical protein
MIFAGRNFIAALFPQVIGLLVASALRSVFLKHAGEDVEIARRDVDDLKTDIIEGRVKMVVFAPAAAGAEDHEGIIGNISGQLDSQIEILVCRDWFLTVNFEATSADIG